MNKSKYNWWHLFFSLSLIFFGMLMFLFTASSLLLDTNLSRQIANDIPVLSDLLFNPLFPYTLLRPVLLFDLFISLLQIIVGILLLDRKIGGVYGAIILLFPGLILSFLNPRLTGIYFLAVILWHTGFLYLLFHGDFRRNYLKKGRKPPVNFTRERPALILFIAILEMTVGLSLLRGIICFNQYLEFTFLLPAGKNFVLFLSVSKSFYLALSLLLCISGLLLFDLTKLGRLMNICICLLSFLLTLIFLFFINPHLNVSDRSGPLIFILFNLIFSSSFFIFLTNPNIKSRFL